MSSNGGTTTFSKPNVSFVIVIYQVGAVLVNETKIRSEHLVRDRTLGNTIKINFVFVIRHLSSPLEKLWVLTLLRFGFSSVLEKHCQRQK